MEAACFRLVVIATPDSIYCLPHKLPVIVSNVLKNFVAPLKNRSACRSSYETLAKDPRDNQGLPVNDPLFHALHTQYFMEDTMPILWQNIPQSPTPSLIILSN